MNGVRAGVSDACGMHPTTILRGGAPPTTILRETAPAQNQALFSAVVVSAFVRTPL